MTGSGRIYLEALTGPFHASISIIMALLLLASGSLSAAPVGYGPGDAETLPGSIEITGDWLVTGSHTYSNETIEVGGNVTVRGKLVLDDSSLLINNTGTVVRGIVIESGGTLVLRNGSTISGVASDGFYFEAQQNSNVLIQNSTVFGCGISGSVHSLMGVHSSTSNFTINNSRILNGEAGLVADGGTFDVFGLSLDDMRVAGVMLLNGSYLRMIDSSIRSVSGSGIYSELSNMTMDKVVFDNVDESITAVNSSAHISSALLHGTGPYLMQLKGCDVRIEDSNSFDPQGGAVMVRAGGASPAELFMLNCSLLDIAVEDAQASVLSAKRFDVKVVRAQGLPGVGAQVEIADIDGKRTFIGSTDDRGLVLDAAIPYLKHSSSGRRYLTPHTVSVFLDGAIRHRTVNLTSSYMETFEVLFSTPEVSILSPVKYEWYQGSPVSLVASITDVRPLSDVWIRVDGRAEVRVGDMNELLMDIHLQDGEHTIQVIAMNDDGKTGNSTVTFGIDSIPPIVTIDAASRVQFTNVSMHYIRGSCSDDAVIWVSGTMYPVNDGRFQAPYMLMEGLNRIEVIALDRAGNRDSQVLEITLDTTPPTLIVSSPLNGTGIRESSVKVKGMVDPSTVTLHINGVEADIDDGYFDHLVTGLLEGSNTIILVGTDVTGSMTVRRIALTVDTIPPEIVLVGFSEITNQKRITIEGISDTLDTVVYVNGVLATVSGFDFQAEIELTDGENWIEVRALDPLGNQVVMDRNVILDREAPAFERFDPPHMTVLTTNVLELRVEVYDELGVRIVRGRTGGSQFKDLEEGAEWKWVLLLSEGENILDLEAVDRAGNVRNSQVVYIYRPPVFVDDVKPDVWFIRPENDAALERGPIIVEGRAKDDVELASVYLRLDGEPVQVTGLENWVVTIEPETGAHVLEAIAIDSSGNTNSTMIRFFVVDTSTGPADEGDGTNPWVLLMIGVILLFLLIVLVYLVINNIRIKALVDEKRRMDEASYRRPRTLGRTAGRGRPQRDSSRGRGGPGTR
ncbi:MAG: hypothetical protein QCI82_09460 [Candidatus Thermoplasmatota archaeon]|nr:hypothetical protein [Candidatus Thermoplasmatota archaeon]